MLINAQHVAFAARFTVARSCRRSTVINFGVAAAVVQHSIKRVLQWLAGTCVDGRKRGICQPTVWSWATNVKSPHMRSVASKFQTCCGTSELLNCLRLPRNSARATRHSHLRVCLARFYPLVVLIVKFYERLLHVWVNRMMRTVTHFDITHCIYHKFQIPLGTSRHARQSRDVM